MIDINSAKTSTDEEFKEMQRETARFILDPLPKSKWWDKAAHRMRENVKITNPNLHPRDVNQDIMLLVSYLSSLNAQVATIRILFWIITSVLIYIALILTIRS